MIVKFFKRGTGNTRSGESVENYLLNDERQEKEQALVLRGDSSLTTAIINGLDFKKTYTSGCLSFAENEGEKLTDQQKHEIMDSFETALFSDFDCTKTTGYWVQHTDKGRLELNFCFANVELEKGRSLTVYNHETDRKRLYAWKAITIADYGLIDPDHPDRKRDFVAVTSTAQDPHGKINITKQGIGEYLLSQAQQGKINNRDDVMAFLRNQLKVEITRETKNSITIQTPHLKTGRPQKIRLEGSLYERDFTAITTDPNYRVERARNYNQRYINRINELRAMYHNLSKYKSEKLRERYERDKARANELARKRRQQNDKREREPVKQHSEQASARTSKYIRKHTEPGSANVISPGPADDPRATGISTFNQAELRPTATADSQPLQSPFDTTIEHGRSGIIGGAYLPSGAYQFNDLVESTTNISSSSDSSIGSNDSYLSTPNRDTSTGITTHDRHNSPSGIDIKTIIRNLAKSAKASLSEYAETIKQYITDVKVGTTDSISELDRESEQRQQTIRELISQTGAVRATAQQIILDREREPAPAPQPVPAQTQAPIVQQEKDNRKDEPALAQAPQPTPTPSTNRNRPRLR